MGKLNEIAQKAYECAVRRGKIDPDNDSNIVIGGLSNTLRYKWFDLNFMFSYQFGGYSYDISCF